MAEIGQTALNAFISVRSRFETPAARIFPDSISLLKAVAESLTETLGSGA